MESGRINTTQSRAPEAEKAISANGSEETELASQDDAQSESDNRRGWLENIAARLRLVLRFF
jgi:hypothetical protein